MYIVEGNIGAGKSTFMHAMNRYLPQVKTVLEPVEAWNSANGGESSLLANFNRDPKRWSFTMETFAMMSRVRDHFRDQARTDNLVVVERSIYSGHYVFSLNGYLQGFMTEKEWAIYQSFFNYLIPGHCKPPQGFIYLRVEPEIVHNRIKKRMRTSEDVIPLDYLKQIHDRHDEFLLEKKSLLKSLKMVPVLVLDCNKDFENNEEISRKLCSAVAKFMGIDATKREGLPPEVRLMA